MISAASIAPLEDEPAIGTLLVTFRGLVYPWHLDHMDHMNVQHYAGAFDQSTWVLLARVGLNAHYFRENRRGMAALEQTIHYKSELRAGDIFEIRSAIVEVRGKAIRMLHRMYKAGTDILAASTTILGVHLDTEARKSVPLPQEVRDQARTLIAPAVLNEPAGTSGPRG